jgi:hypothetical protein
MSKAERLEFVQTQILAIRGWLADNPVGVTSIAREGFSATYNRKQALEELQYWENEEKKLTNTKPAVVRPIDMSESWD